MPKQKEKEYRISKKGIILFGGGDKNKIELLLLSIVRK